MKHIKYILTGFWLFLFNLIIQAQDLNLYIEEAVKSNPELQAFELKYHIEEEKTNEANTLPNTEFGVGYFVSEPETRTGPQRFKLSAKQMLPWFGTLNARKNYAKSVADASYIDFIVAKRKLALSIAESYYKLYALQAKQVVLQEQINLLKHYEELAMTGVEVGKTSAVKVLQLQIRNNKLEEQQQILRQEFLGEQSLFNTYLNRDNAAFVAVPEEIVIPKKTEEVAADSLIVHPELLKYEALYNSVAQSEIVNQKSRNPNFGIGIDYINVSKRTDMNMPDNGKDVFMPTISLSIPIFNKSIRSKTLQNKLQQREIEAQKQAKYNQLNTLLDRAIKNRVAARISYATQTKNLEQVVNAEEILVKSYETEIVDFNELLDILDLKLSIQTEKIEAEKKYYTQSAVVNYITNQLTRGKPMRYSNEK